MPFFPPNKLGSHLELRVEALFPYHRHLSEFEGVTMRARLFMFQTEEHTESEVFFCKDVVLIMVFRMRLAGKDTTKEQLNATLESAPLPTVKDIAHPLTATPVLMFQKGAMSAEGLRRNNITRASLTNVA